MIDKVDEKVEKSELKTINGESILGEGDLRVGVKSVESVEELEKLDAEVGDMATVGASVPIQVKIADCYYSVDFEKDWDKYTAITRVEEIGLISDTEEMGVNLYKFKDGRHVSTIIIGTENGYRVYKISKNDTYEDISLEEINGILAKNEYRFGIGYRWANIDSFFRFYTNSVSADAYIKSDSWEKLAKEYVVSSEEELNALSVENGTIAKVAYDYEVRSYRNTKISNSTDKDFDRVVGLDVLSVPSSSFEITIYAQELEANNKGLSVICYGTGRIDGVIHRREGNVSYREEVYNLALDYNIKADKVKRFNELLRSMDCLLEHNSYVSEEFYALIDSALRFHIAVRAVSDAYIKGETWDKLAKAENVVSSVEELNAINAKAGDLAKVASERKSPKFADFYQSNSTELASEDTIRANIDKFTRIVSIDFNTPPYSFAAGLYPMLLYGTESPLKIEFVIHPQVAGARVYDGLGNYQEYIFFDTTESSDMNIEHIKAINDILSNGDYRYIPQPKYPELQLVYDIVFKANQELGYADLYIKGETWTRFLKEGDVTGSNITIDSELSETSENPVQNKVVTEALMVVSANMGIQGEQIYSLGKVLIAKADTTYVDNAIASVIGGGSTPFRIWYSDELTPAQKEDNVKAYNALMNKEAFDFELLYIDEGEDYYSINKEVVTGFTCHMDSQKVHISILVAATEDGLMTEPLYLTSDGTFEFEAPPL